MTNYSFIKQKSFQFGLILKIFLIIFCIPIIHTDLFNNFIINFIQNPTFDPWSHFLNGGGNVLSFPYGHVMLYVITPFSFLGWKIGLITGNKLYFSGLGLRLTLLLIDFLGLFILSKVFPKNQNRLVLYYWLSPLLIYVTYLHGQLDIVPAVIMLCGFFFLMKRKFLAAALLFGISCAVKFSMILSIPFTLIYLWQNMRLRGAFKMFFISLISSLTLFSFLPIFLEGYRQMVLGTPLIKNIFWLSFPLEGIYKIYFLPIVFSLLVYLMWRMKRTNYDLLISITGISFLISILMMPPTPGWYLWSFPFLIFYQIKADIPGKLLTYIFSIFSVFLLYPYNSGSKLLIGEVSIFNYRDVGNYSIIYSFVLALGIIICIRWYRDSIQKNDYFLLSRRPLSIGISGPACSGKKYLCNNLIDVFGINSVNHINSDNYKKWLSDSPMRMSKSRNDPMHFDLLKLSQDLQSNIIKNNLSIDKENSILQKLNFTNKKNDSIIVTTGMHLFAADSLADKFDIKIFMDTSIKVREHWSSNYKNSNNIDFELEQKKFKNLNLKQKKTADIIFFVKPINENLVISDLDKSLPLKLEVFLSDAIFLDRLSKALISICGVKLDTDINLDNLSANISIEGDFWSGDIELLAFHLIPHLDELLDLKPKWHGNVFGLMQIIILLQIDHKLNKFYCK